MFTHAVCSLLYFPRFDLILASLGGRLRTRDSGGTIAQALSVLRAAAAEGETGTITGQIVALGGVGCSGGGGGRRRRRGRERGGWKVGVPPIFGISPPTLTGGRGAGGRGGAGGVGASEGAGSGGGRGRGGKDDSQLETPRLLFTLVDR